MALAKDIRDEFEKEAEAIRGKKLKQAAEVKETLAKQVKEKEVIRHFKL